MLALLILELLRFKAQFVVRERLALELAIFCVKAAIGALIPTFVGRVERSEEHQSVAVNLFFTSQAAAKISRCSASSSALSGAAASYGVRPLVSLAFATTSRTSVGSGCLACSISEKMASSSIKFTAPPCWPSLSIACAPEGVKQEGTSPARRRVGPVCRSELRVRPSKLQ